MLAQKQIIKRLFSTQGFNHFPAKFELVSAKFPEGTVAGTYKRAVAEN
jgi:hypothetical protein